MQSKVVKPGQCLPVLCQNPSSMALLPKKPASHSKPSTQMTPISPGLRKGSDNLVHFGGICMAVGRCIRMEMLGKEPGADA